MRRDLLRAHRARERSRRQLDRALVKWWAALDQEEFDRAIARSASTLALMKKHKGRRR